MIVDCSDCKVRDIACADCVVTVLLGAPGSSTDAGFRGHDHPEKIDIDQEELGAIGVLADSGLVPRLRLVVDDDGRPDARSLSGRDKGGESRAV